MIINWSTDFNIALKTYRTKGIYFICLNIGCKILIIVWSEIYSIILLSMVFMPVRKRCLCLIPTFTNQTIDNHLKIVFILRNYCKIITCLQQTYAPFPATSKINHRTGRKQRADNRLKKNSFAFDVCLFPPTEASRRDWPRPAQWPPRWFGL